MERLTYKSSMGDYGSTKDYKDWEKEKCVLRNALGAYEDLGYSPEELKEIIREVKNEN